MKKPNILFLMADQMQAQILEQGHPCQTPFLDQLAARGMRFRKAYTTNAICCPARASLMTGLLPHNHGVLEVIHCVDDDQSNIRKDKPHWAQRLVEAGYQTGYFGKWHVERSEKLEDFGWQVNGASNDHDSEGSPLFHRYAPKDLKTWSPSSKYPVGQMVQSPPYYKDFRHYGVTDKPLEKRPMGVVAAMAADFLEEKTKEEDRPWCCFVSFVEPHDPFVCGEEAYSRYDVDKLPLPPTVHTDFAGQPNLYRKMAANWGDMTDRQRREAAACYYASITEIDQLFGRLMKLVEKSGQLENTIVVVTSDHGELLGAHGLYCKNVSAFEEVYNIPLIIAGPEIPKGLLSDARVGIHDLAPTLLDLAGAESIRAPDSRSFAEVLHDPKKAVEFRTGYAEYNGGRYRFTQRIFWEDSWKYIHNGFDFDEMYDLSTDPNETKNLSSSPAHQERAKYMMGQIWKRIRDTNEHTLLNSNYPATRAAPYGPKVLEKL
jgi:arylsulfatase A-like enzyme